MNDGSADIIIHNQFISIFFKFYVVWLYELLKFMMSVFSSVIIYFKNVVRVEFSIFVIRKKNVNANVSLVDIRS